MDRLLKTSRIATETRIEGFVARRLISSGTQALVVRALHIRTPNGTVGDIGRAFPHVPSDAYPDRRVGSVRLVGLECAVAVVDGVALILARCRWRRAGYDCRPLRTPGISSRYTCGLTGRRDPRRASELERQLVARGVSHVHRRLKRQFDATIGGECEVLGAMSMDVPPPQGSALRRCRHHANICRDRVYVNGRQINIQSSRSANIALADDVTIEVLYRFVRE